MRRGLGSHRATVHEPASSPPTTDLHATNTPRLAQAEGFSRGLTESEPTRRSPTIIEALRGKRCPAARLEERAETPSSPVLLASPGAEAATGFASVGLASSLPSSAARTQDGPGDSSPAASAGR